MPTLFELLNQQVETAGTGQMSGAALSAGTDGPIELADASGFSKPRMTPRGIPEPKAQATPRRAQGAGQGGFSATDALTLETGFDSEGFDDDPVGSLSSASKGGFFDALIKIGAGMAAMGGDASGAKVVAGQEQGKIASAREARLREASRYANLAKMEDMRAKEVEMAGKVLAATKEIDDPAQVRATLGAALRRAEPGSYAALILTTGLRDPEGAAEQAAVAELVSKAGSLGYRAQAAEQAGRLPDGTLQKHIAEMTDINVIADKMRTNGELSPQAYAYLSRNPKAMERAANALGIMGPGITKKAQETAAVKGAEEGVKGPKTGKLVDELGNLTTEASNSLRAESASVFGGLYDPATGAFKMSDKESQVRAQELSAMAAKTLREGGAKSVGEAVKMARETMGVEVTAGGSKDKPAEPKSEAEFKALKKGTWFVNPADGKVMRKK